MSVTDPRDGSRSITPDQAAQCIRFALAELGTRNGHHEFEHICRNLARRRIASNILPSTGPVSQGGDQGADFETYAVPRPMASDGVIATAPDGKIVFACSLAAKYKTKIRSDLRKIQERLRPTSVYYFSSQSVPVSVRHRLENESRQKLGIELHVLDVQAISEMVAEPDLYWIAQRYLAIAFDLELPSSPLADEQYQQALKIRVAKSLYITDFVELRRAARIARKIPELNSHLSGLLQELRKFRTHEYALVRRQCIYEDLMAACRELCDADRCDEDIREYFAGIESMTEPQELEDATHLSFSIWGPSSMASSSSRWSTSFTRWVKSRHKSTNVFRFLVTQLTNVLYSISKRSTGS